jgi:hypothetical protein
MKTLRALRILLVVAILVFGAFVSETSAWGGYGCGGCGYGDYGYGGYGYRGGWGPGGRWGYGWGGALCGDSRCGGCGYAGCGYVGSGYFSSNAVEHVPANTVGYPASTTPHARRDVERGQAAKPAP